MQYLVQHRVNTVADLKKADPSGGVEIDLRSNVHHAQALHLSHDPWLLGESFDAWLEVYARRGFAGPLVLNTKEDGLEEAVLRRLEAFGLEHFFFLDTAPPTLARLLSRSLGAHLCLRLSMWEPIEAADPWLTATEASHRPAWGWLDCFGGEPLPAHFAESLKQTHPDLKICLVSPELQRAPISSIANFVALGRLSTTVCTKRPDLWRRAMAEAL